MYLFFLKIFFIIDTIIIVGDFVYTVYDYLKYYKNTSLEDVHWNALDNLVCAVLVYLPVKSFNKSFNLSEFCDYALKFKKNLPGMMAPISYEILDIIKNCKRYKELSISNFENVRTNEVQFGAATFRTDCETIVAFKGTDGSMIGWLENCRLIYEYPTYTQKKAINYLNNNISFLDNEVYVVGHSKGGNLAMASAMETNKFKKIKKVYNFDGPGFRKKEFESLQFKKLKRKLVNILPTGSVVGVILNNDNYNVVLSNKLAFDEHFPTSWSVFGEYFVKGKLSLTSSQFHDRMSKGLENLDDVKLKQLIESFFKSFDKEYTSQFKLNFLDIRNFIRNAKNIDKQTANYLLEVVDSLFLNEKK